MNDAIGDQSPLIYDRTVLALFSDADTAEEALMALKDAGYDDVALTSGDADDAGKPLHRHGFWHRIKALFGSHDDAGLYGEGVRRGHTLITAHTEQGRAAHAVEILDMFGPVDIEGGEQAWASDLLSDPLADLPDAEASPDTAIAGEVGSVAEEELLGDRDPDAGNARVRSYVRNVPAAREADAETDNLDRTNKLVYYP